MAPSGRGAVATVPRRARHGGGRVVAMVGPRPFIAHLEAHAGRHHPWSTHRPPSVMERVGRHPELLLHAAAAPQIQRGCSFRGCGDLTPKRRSTRMALHQCVVPTLQQGVMAQRLFSKVAALGLGAAAVASSRRRSSWLQVPAFTELANRSYGGTPIQSAP